MKGSTLWTSKPNKYSKRYLNTKLRTPPYRENGKTSLTSIAVSTTPIPSKSPPLTHGKSMRFWVPLSPGHLWQLTYCATYHQSPTDENEGIRGASAPPLHSAF